MADETKKKVLKIVQSLDNLKHQIQGLMSRLTAQMAEANSDLETAVLESIIYALIASSNRMNLDILTSRYRLLRSFTDDYPELPLLEAELDPNGSMVNGTRRRNMN